mmetsp:Transcript_49607/g.124737  ORF Transcript_49607/g.124737 Transcript_49607/m.124737 type:complete len:234 (-) Transcript_49607:84-785(-)|eukprot:CAMPEP_0177645388 /NCGR_PEP_ID=MMETSP0447-20121125/9220_1 /TAXON_ID=0 /ORGANISM="Stygamoeba regulata, Strain BSH-02190019" /LENGTH=233 /DNA_ID=CAMNT_0019147863 /DNA_START=898 /DNA_END=1599 /DNA_ORIENTATION=+
MDDLVRKIQFNGRTLELVHRPSSNDTTGGIVWNAAYVVLRSLEESLDSIDWSTKTVVDLGSGTGVLGIALTVLGAKVFLTDLPEQLDLIQTNVLKNCTEEERTRAQVLPLTWGESLEPFVGGGQRVDYVVCSDLLFCAIRVGCEDSLFECITGLTSRDACGSVAPPSKVLFCYQERIARPEEEFLRRCQQVFSVEETTNLCMDDFQPGEDDEDGIESLFYSDPEIRLFWFTRK